VFKQVFTSPEDDDTKCSKEAVQPAVGLSASFIADAKVSRKLQSPVSLGKWKMADQTPTSPTSPNLDMELDETDKQLIRCARKEAESSSNHLKQQAKAKLESICKSKAKGKAKGKAKSKAKQVNHTQEKTVAGGPPDRKTLLKRLTSSAYHKAPKDAVQEGLDEGEAKEVARIAYKKAAEEFGKSE
jgi:hypothetical protein